MNTGCTEKLSKINSKICEFCGNIFYFKRPRDRNKRFCNRKCASQICSGQYNVKPKIPCNGCGILIKSYQKYCSQKCFHQQTKIVHIRICKNCKQKFILKNIADEKRGKGIYCSNSCSSRKFNLNQNSFNEIKTEEQAYWLGFLIADGYNSNNELVVNLSIKDEKHLSLLKDFLKSDKPIKSRPKNMLSLRIASKKLCSDLKKHGCIKAKTFIVEFPKINPLLHRHFLRGVSDGDGCFYVSRAGGGRWSMYTASPKFLKQIQDIFNQNNIKVNKTSDQVLSITNFKGYYDIYKFFYEGATVFLKRKEEKARILASLFKSV